MGDSQKPRGRARGRSRDVTRPTGEAGARPEIVAASTQGAWGRRPGLSQAPRAAPTSASPGAGMASASTPLPAPLQPFEKLSLASASGGSGDVVSVGRGALRGGRIINPELLHTRPKNLISKQGAGGRLVHLQANYFKILTSTDWCLFKYHVDFSPEEDATIVRKAMMKNHQETLGAYIYDGTVMYTSQRLPQPLELFAIRKKDEEKIRMTFRFAGDMSSGDPHYLQFFNIVMRKALQCLKLQLVGRNYFDPHNKVSVPEYKLELWPGYETSIRQHESDILMCAEITHKVMRCQTLLDILNDCYKQHGDRYQDIYRATVVGMTVLTDYNNQTYKVEDVDFTQSPASTFEKKGQAIKYQQYYFERYRIQIRSPSQPLLISRSNARDRRAGVLETVCLIPELCRSTGLTDDMRKDWNMMRELAKHTRLNPQGRMMRLLSFNKRLLNEPAVVQDLTNWNLKLDTKLVDLPGRVMNPETIVFGNNVRISAGPEADWTQELRKQSLYNPVNLDNWVMLVPSRLAQEAEGFVSTMSRSVRDMRFTISKPRSYTIQNDNAASYTSAIEDIMRQTYPQLILCILSNNRADRYSAIKKKCCVDRPVASQCILQKQFRAKGVQSIATKIAVQLACKIGGAPWSVVVPATGIMVVGFDACRDTNTNVKNFGALVASLDHGFTQYYSAVSAHTNGEELSNSLAVNVCKAVHKYKEKNGALPSRIIFYRDGVGEGDISYVYTHEVENLKSKLATLYGNPDAVQLAYIIVTKRIGMRLFFNNNNPPPGTVVDDVITNPIKYDFYVVSQFVRGGSVSPTGYTVISDNAKLDASKLQQLSYKLTHTYFNWSGTVSVPAPCQFAHKLAFLVSQYIHTSPSNHLETLLYFL